MQQILFNLSLLHNIAPFFLEYIGSQDETETLGCILYLFNVEDPKSPKYRSTVAFMIRVGKGVA